MNGSTETGSIFSSHLPIRMGNGSNNMTDFQPALNATPFNCSILTPDDINNTNFKLDLRAKHIVQISAYSVMFILSFIGNMTLFIILFNNHRQKPDRINKLLLNMNIADLMVTLVSIPKEILYSYTIIWLGPPALCPVTKFIDTLSVYLSSNVLIVITLDRFFCILNPMYPAKAERFIFPAIIIAWLVAVIGSIPQLILFTKIQHPCYSWYTPCAGRYLIHQIPLSVEVANTIFNAIMVYFMPLGVILVCYSIIMGYVLMQGIRPLENSMNNESTFYESPSQSSIGGSRQSISGRRQSSRISSKAFHLTATMVIIFLVCWTPYFIAVVLHFINKDKGGGEIVPPMVMTVLFIFANLNSVANPYIYAYFSNRLEAELRGVLYCLAGRTPPRHNASISRSSGGKPRELSLPVHNHNGIDDSKFDSELIPLRVSDFKDPKVGSRATTVCTPLSPVSQRHNSDSYRNRESSGSDWHLEI